MAFATFSKFGESATGDWLSIDTQLPAKSRCWRSNQVISRSRSVQVLLHATYAVGPGGKSSGSRRAAAAFGRTTLGLQAEISGLQIVQFQEKEAVKFVTPSRVIAIVATSLPPSLIKALKKKLQLKLKRQGLLPFEADCWRRPKTEPLMRVVPTQN